MQKKAKVKLCDGCKLSAAIFFHENGRIYCKRCSDEVEECFLIRKVN